MMAQTRSLLAISLASLLMLSLGGCQSAPEPENKASTAPVQDAVMWQLFTLNTKAAFFIQVPESKVRSKLAEFVNLQGQAYVKGEFEDGPVRGTVLLQQDKFQTLNPKWRGLTLMIAPFVVSNQGSGNFWYLGLFGLNKEARTVTHLDSVLVGDRVDIRALSPSESSMLPLRVNAEVLVQAPGQSMTESPRLLDIRRFEVNWDGKIVSLD